MVGMEIWGPFGTIRIINIYNDCEHSQTIETLKQWYENTRVASHPPTPDLPHDGPTHAIWLGDFNRHHPLWEEERNHHLFTNEADALTQPLLDMIATYGMKMTLPKDIPTLEQSRTKNWTRPDNVFASEDIAQAFLECNTAPDKRPPLADHLPIMSVIDITPTVHRAPPRRNWQAVDWNEFRGELLEQLTKIPPAAEIPDCETFKTAIQDLENTIHESVRKTVPQTTLSPYTKRWWSKELSAARKAFQRLSSHSHRQRTFPDHPVHEQYRIAWNRYSQLIRDTKREHWVEWLEDMTDSGLWTVHKLISGPSTDGG
jgi:hypothetical protein